MAAHSSSVTFIYCIKIWVPLTIFGDLSCKPVVNLRNAFNLNQSAVEKLLPFIKLGSSCRKSISNEVCCFFDPIHLLLDEFLGCMVMIEMSGA